MTNSTSEREQRLKEIRDGIANGWQTCGVAPNDPRMVQMKFETSEAAKDFVDRMANFDLPLSLLDSEAAGGNETPDHVWVELRSQHAFTVEPEPYVETVKYVRDTLFNEHYEALLRAALLREQAAATSMRDRCVETVKAIRDEYRRNSFSTDDEAYRSSLGFAVDVLDRAILGISSAALDSIARRERKQQ